MYIEVTNRENEVVAVMISSIEVFLTELRDDGNTKAKIILTSGRTLNTKETFDQIKERLEALA
jgi:hypothetical protein